MTSINYVQCSRCYFNSMKINVAISLLNEAIRSNRYFNVYNYNNNVREEGIDPLYGPKDFVMPQEISIMDVNLIHYETFLIFPQFYYDQNLVPLFAEFQQIYVTYHRINSLW